MSNYQSEAKYRDSQPDRLPVGLLIHSDILSKVNCAQTSHTALHNPRAKSATIGWCCVNQEQMCSTLNISEEQRVREDKTRARNMR